MTTPAPTPVYGEFVYVRHIVGNPYGVAGQTTGVEYDVDIENLIEGGYMTIAPGSVSDPYTVPLGSYGTDPLNPAPGEWVYVYNNVGTPYGGAGTVVGVEYTTHIHRLVSDGSMRLTLPPTSELEQAPLYGDNSFASLGMVKDLMYAYYGGYDGSDGDYSHLILSDRLRDAIAEQMNVTYDPTVQALLDEARSLNTSSLNARNAAQAAATQAGNHASDVSGMRDHVDQTREHVDLTSEHVDQQATTASTAAATAISKALEASGHATTATTKASEAAQSRADALTFRNTANTAATTATTKATEAGNSAASALTSRNEAQGFRNEAAASALTLNQRVETGTKEIGVLENGRLYFRTAPEVGVPLTVDNSAGTRVFLGSTMIHGDTGWRLLGATDLLNGWSVYNQYLGPQIRRVGDIVQLYVPSLGLDGTNATSQAFYFTPDGFRPVYNYASFGALYLGSTPYRVAQDQSNLLIVGTPKGQVSGFVQWRTSQTWPAILPGTPA